MERPRHAGDLTKVPVRRVIGFIRPTRPWASDRRNPCARNPLIDYLLRDGVWAPPDRNRILRLPAPRGVRRRMKASINHEDGRSFTVTRFFLNVSLAGDGATDGGRLRLRFRTLSPGLPIACKSERSTIVFIEMSAVSPPGGHDQTAAGEQSI